MKLRVSDFVKFIEAREALRKRKEAIGYVNEPPPWTKDKILQRFRFCNVRREDDKVTRWIADNWRTRLEGDKDLWFWMLVARLVNTPETLSLIAYRTHFKWDENKFVDAIRERMRSGEKAWGGAYIVSTNGNRMEKASYIAQKVLTPAWEARGMVRPMKHDTLRAFCGRLLTLNGVQGFIAGQVIADAKYATQWLKMASDWHEFAISGPGSRRGLNRVIGNDKNRPWKEREWHEVLLFLRGAVNTSVRVGIGELHAQDIQNCLCEFDKYERVRLGEGTPRSRYPGI